MNQETKSGQIFDLPTLRRLYTFVDPYKKQFFGLIGIIIVSSVLAPLLPLLIKYTIDGPIATGDYSELALMMAIMIGVLIVQGLVSFVNTYLSGWLGQYIIRDIRVTLYEKIINLRLRFFDQTPIGRLVTRVISDVETLSNVFSDGMAAIAGDILQLDAHHRGHVLHRLEALADQSVHDSADAVQYLCVQGKNQGCL